MSPGASRSAPARVRCFWAGTDFAPPIWSYRKIPAATYGRSHHLLVNGNRNGSGLTRCGASVERDSSRSRNASCTNPNSSCSR
ncbi:Uncharacterised protein [Mycobacteroides abscessus subsp. abscessus]|nr:Uncharacterised protein [Mycobacteroides abscessus subsp. abscessus]